MATGLILSASSCKEMFTNEAGLEGGRPLGRCPLFLRSGEPLSNDQLRNVAPSIFAGGAHTCIPTSAVLDGLRKEGFESFMVAQTRMGDEGKRVFTKHMLRLRHASQINDDEANEIILLNLRGGAGGYAMLAGMFRFVCANGLVWGDRIGDVRVRPKGEIVDNVVEGAFRVLDIFEQVRAQRDGMRATTLAPAAAQVFARSALALKYAPGPAPITESQVLAPRRVEDRKADLWSTFNRVQENLVRGGVPAKAASGRCQRTRAIEGIDQSIKVNRGLWMLAEEIRRLNR